MTNTIGGERAPRGRLMLTGLCLVMLAGCDENGKFSLQPDTRSGEVQARSSSSVKLVERDVEAPDVFQVTDMGLWDGRPSLGGVWVAHPDVKEPERVIIRNTSNSNFVIGALFRRERETPGPALQVSSDAAAALGMLAGAPTQLNVTALRREETPVAPEPDEEAATEPLAETQDIEETALDPVAGAAAAIEASEATEATEAAEATEAKAQTAAASAPAPVETPEPRPAPRASSLEKPFIQVGIFSIEENAQNTATAMRQAGMVPTVLEQSSQGKAFWRVIVGPVTSASERGTVLKKIQGIGFADAYPVTN